MNSERQIMSPNRIPPANLLLVIVLIVLTGALAWQVWSANATPNISGGGDYLPRAVTPKGELPADERETIAVFREASPSVVFIRTKGDQSFEYGNAEQDLSSGTGFIWDREGHIVTNLHVVKAALNTRGSELQVQFADHTVVDAEILGGVHEYDIAILKVKADRDLLTPIKLGTSNDLLVGQKVLAIGSPFGFDQTLSTGVIGGLNRSVASEDTRGILAGLIQTDAAINPGNSGGPLLDSSGRMIGVNTAIVSPTGVYSGLGFAVPVSSVISSVELVLEESTGPRKPILGVTILAPKHAIILGVPAAVAERGLFIKQIQPDGPAAQTTLRATRQLGYRIILGDQIAAIDDEPVPDIETLERILASRSPGDSVTLEIYRGQQRGTVEITLQAQKLLFW